MAENEISAVRQQLMLMNSSLCSFPFSLLPLEQKISYSCLSFTYRHRQINTRDAATAGAAAFTASSFSSSFIKSNSFWSHA
jgi:hypothetical protein